MADISDVWDALAALLYAAMYPGGANSPSASGYPCKVVTGWPQEADLDGDLAAGMTTISVYCQPGMERNTTRYPQEWKDKTLVAPLITATADQAHSKITLGGTTRAGDYVSIICFNKAFSYALVGGDTLATAAAALAALVNASMPAYAVGPAIIIPNRSDMVARCAAPGVIIRELGRSDQRFQIMIWAPKNAIRVATNRIIRPALERTNFLALPDTSSGRLIYECSHADDRGSSKNLSRLDLFFWVEYPTTEEAPGYPITIPQSQINVADGTPQGATYIQNS